MPQFESSIQIMCDYPAYLGSAYFFETLVDFVSILTVNFQSLYKLPFSTAHVRYNRNISNFDFVIVLPNHLKRLCIDCTYAKFENNAKKNTSSKSFS